jgi:hypothetical protein
MKSVSFLIFWLLPLLPSGGHDLSPSPGHPSRVVAHASSAVIESAASAYLFGDPSNRGLAASIFDEEEDSLEDFCLDSGSWPSPLWRNLGGDDLASSHPRLNLLRSPSHQRPLRC